LGFFGLFFASFRLLRLDLVSISFVRQSRFAKSWPQLSASRKAKLAKQTQMMKRKNSETKKQTFADEKSQKFPNLQPNEGHISLLSPSWSAFCWLF